jgi:predicted Zn-dependent peptidase
MEFQHLTLDNGLTLVAEINPEAASMGVGFFARTGSRDETAEVAGVSHFLEHMMFKGTPHRSAFDVNLEFDRIGADYNAFTTEENTVYYGAVLPDFQERLLDLLGDMLRPSLRQEDFDLERNVILDEIARYEDMPSYRCYEKLMGEHFTGHPLGNSVLGTPESIRELSRDQMQEYFDRRYSPTNVTIVGAGNLDFDAFVQKVRESCGHWEPREAPREAQAVPRNSGRVVVTDPKVTREHVGLMSSAPSYQDESRDAAQIASTILGDATGSRLYYALVEPAIADRAHMSYDAMDRAGALITLISSDPDRAAEALEIARGELKRFLDEGPSETELTAAKNKTASGATLKGELPMGRLTEVGFDWVYDQSYEPLTERIERLLAVTPEEVLDVVRRHDLMEMTVLALGPLRSL